MAIIRVREVRVNNISFVRQANGAVVVNSSIDIELEDNSVHNFTLEQIVGVAGMRKIMRKLDKFIIRGVINKVRELNRN